MSPEGTGSSPGSGEPAYDVESAPPAFLFDLDGTLIDSVYQHVVAWRQALVSVGIDVSVWRLHRRIGMSGGLFVQALMAETGVDLSGDEVERLQQLHGEAFLALHATVRPLPGARELLLAELTDRGVAWAIATSGREATARPGLDALGVPPGVPVITRDLVRRAKPDP